MKRTAFQAAFPINRQIDRVTIYIPANRCTTNESLTISLAYYNTDNIDIVKLLLAYKIKEITRRRPRLECFQLHQNGIHFPLMLPIIALATLDVIHFVRSAAD